MFYSHFSLKMVSGSQSSDNGAMLHPCSCVTPLTHFLPLVRLPLRSGMILLAFLDATSFVWALYGLSCVLSQTEILSVIDISFLTINFLGGFMLAYGVGAIQYHTAVHAYIYACWKLFHCTLILILIPVNTIYSCQRQKQQNHNRDHDCESLWIKTMAEIFIHVVISGYFLWVVWSYEFYLRRGNLDILYHRKVASPNKEVTPAHYHFTNLPQVSDIEIPTY
mmetsp:Transcript_43201/g.49673  ORF Transcript_43201/g.49673 Transcript_43201/m.49673 type:complete len:222 (+) Transcript_43201:161-826(+)